ncbi:MAG: histidine kinase, partial [Bacteroidota bacterium]
SFLRFFQYAAGDGGAQYFEEAIAYAKQGLGKAAKNQHVFYHQMGLVYQQKLTFVGTKEERITVSDSALQNYYQALQFAQRDGAISTTRTLMSNISILCDYRKTSLNTDCQNILNAPTDQFLNSAYDSIVNNITGDLKDLNRQIVAVEKQEIINRESKNRLLQQIIGGAIFLVALLSFLLLYQQLQKKRLSAKMEALRAQINPHFISNSLNAIENLVNQDQKEAAAKYLIHFSRFSRKILSSSRSGMTSLHNEIDTIEHFLALEKLRFRDKLHYHIYVDNQLQTHMIAVPAMVIQPYVENAIIHGLKPKKQAGTLGIRIEADGKDLRIVIEDDGIGREKSRALQAASVLRKNRKSQGLQISAERIKSMGKVKGKHVSIIDLYDEDQRAEGTKVVLRMPLKQKKKTT